MVLLIASFICLFPISIRIADPFFTHPFQRSWPYRYPILLVWPDHVEMRWVHDLSEVSPRPKGESYTFTVPPERQAWVESKVRNTASPSGNAAWVIHVRQLGAARQQIQLELLGDGITGMIYEARPDEIVPLRLRLAGPGGAFVMLGVQLLLLGGLWILVWFIRRLMPLHRRQSSRSPDNG